MCVYVQIRGWRRRSRGRRAGRERGKRGRAGGGEREGERRGRKLENDECGVREGVGDTSVCISAAKLPFEAGGKEDTGKKRAAGWGRGRKRGKGARGKRARGERERGGEKEIEGQRRRGKADDGGGDDDSSSKC